MTATDPTTEVAERDPFIADHAADLLKLTLRYTGSAPTGNDPTSRNAHYFTAINAWTAYRLLKALQQIDPDLLLTVLDESSEELEDGDVAHRAWDAAEKAGHDPEQWDAEYKAHLAELAAKTAPATA